MPVAPRSQAQVAVLRETEHGERLVGHALDCSREKRAIQAQAGRSLPSVEPEVVYWFDSLSNIDGQGGGG